MNRPDSGLRGAELLLITALLSFLTFLLAYPLSAHPATSVLDAGGDTHLTLWIFGWDIHALTSKVWSIFDANIYYPFTHTLAYSENMIGSAFMVAPVVWLTGNVVLAMNVAALASCVLCGLGTYVLARRLGLGKTGALVAGLIFAFAPPRFFRLGQLHLTTVQWVPFCLASLHAYLQTGLPRHLRWACAFFTIQVYTSGHGAVLAAVSILVLLVWSVMLGEPLQVPKRIRDLGVQGALMLALVIPFVIPYRAVQDEMGLRRSLNDSFAFAPNAASFAASPTYVDRYITSLFTDAPILENARAYLFPGYLTYLLAAAGLLTMRRPFERGPSGPTTAWRRTGWLLELLLLATVGLAIAVSFFGGVRWRFGSSVVFSARQPWRIWMQVAVLAALRLAMVRLAPVDAAGRLNRMTIRAQRWAGALRANPLTYYVVLLLLTFWLSLGPGYWLYRVVYDWPGFSFIRVPSRFTIVSLLCLALLAGSGMEYAVRRFTSLRERWVAIVVTFLLVGEFAAFPLGTTPYSTEPPAVERWLATQPKPFVVAEVPVWEEMQGVYMVHSLAHWQKTVHGYSGMRPDLHSELYDEMAAFPDEKILRKLSGLGVDFIVVHTDYYRPGDWPDVDRRISTFSQWLTLEHAEGNGRVYRLRRPA